MTRTLRDCLHADVRARGLLSDVPSGWHSARSLPEEVNDLESAWCRDCERYCWRQLGGTEWTALTPPA